ncbi:hypothetical protein B0T24DRAFT_698471 [Lasiosphaeria ovina]|uniref:Uncharacterized protein n=1 Tax=Lasiosphaeria ovina TaxID=92902 RepID=A0AAE0KFK5_9PEZI|nr:hypothetical protein B0T24DRAFT_698471 [Lasiosphaeria ovina]
MPMPPSDEEALASLTPQEREFYDWYEANKHIQDMDEWRRTVRNHWKERAMEFKKWLAMWIDRIFGRESYVVPSSEYGNHDFFLLGEAKLDGIFTCFGLIPGAFYLTPNMGADDYTEGILHRSILGINTNIPIDFTPPEDGGGSPSKRRYQQRSSGEGSVRSTDSGDIDYGHGFIFAQLGPLYAFTGPRDWEEARKAMTYDDIIEMGHWTTTGFGVVTEIDKNGRSGLMYNFYQDNYNVTDVGPITRTHKPVFDQETMQQLPEIGRLVKGCTTTFTVAKIAENLGQLGAGKSFKIDPREFDEQQLVRWYG